MDNTKKNYIWAGVYFVLFLLLIVIIKTVDVAAIGPENTSIGLSHINGYVHEMFGINHGLYVMTKMFGLLSFALVGVFVLIGLIQLVQRKSVSKVDREILCLGGLYALVAVTFALFEVIIINYRPIIEEGAEHVEASFPSTHTLIIVTVWASFMLIMDKYIKNDILKRVLRIASMVIICLTVIGRLACGVHWFTDILGGCLISLCYINLFAAVSTSSNSTAGERK